jgi:hypothetical protein
MAGRTAGIVNKDQAEALKRLFEAGNPDGGTTVTPEPDGVHVTISDPRRCPGLSGPGGMDAELCLADDSPWLGYFMAYLITEAAEAAAAEIADPADDCEDSRTD